MRKLLTVLAMIGTFATPAIASDHSAVQNDRTALPQQGSESFCHDTKVRLSDQFQQPRSHRRRQPRLQ